MARANLGDWQISDVGEHVAIESTLVGLPIQATLATLGEPLGHEPAYGEAPGRCVLDGLRRGTDARHGLIVHDLRELLLTNVVAGRSVAPHAARVAESDPELRSSCVDSHLPRLPLGLYHTCHSATHGFPLRTSPFGRVHSSNRGVSFRRRSHLASDAMPSLSAARGRLLDILMATSRLRAHNDPPTAASSAATPVP